MFSKYWIRNLLAAGGLLGGLALPTFGEDSFERTEDRTRCEHYDALRNPFFGDLHVHTRYSLDASTQGTRTTPREASSFARGAPLGIQPWGGDGVPERQAQLRRPLDFAAVTDHAELFGETYLCTTPGAEGYDSLICAMYRRWPRLAFFFMNGRVGGTANPVRHRFCGDEGGERCRSAAAGPWKEMQDAAAEAYDPAPECRFTPFVAYEWTGGPTNMHRNVVFRNAVVPALPTSAVEATTAWQLWDSLESECRQGLPGCEVLAIPHNSNLSGGVMFESRNAEGEPLRSEDARKRIRNEPLVEIMQHKGASECSVATSAADELCDFESLDYDTFFARFVGILREEPVASNFVRPILGEGLVQQDRLGANPFKLGILASTDTHLGTPGLVMEDNYPGHGGAGVAVGKRLPAGLLDPIEYNPGGLAVAWSEENSRDALYAAFERRETYGTSGPRMRVRFFGGWDLPEDLCRGSDFVETGYARGVPMGGDLPPREEGGAPVFAVSALRDPGTPGHPGGLLQRLQVVKVWVEEGEAREAVFDIAGDPDSDATVDLDSCRVSGEGAESLCTVWRDPGFQPSQSAVYYARVLENPSCRWSTWVCNEAGSDCADPGSVTTGFEPCCAPDTRRSVQERAWTSPIWYTP
ncbi:MAG: DUF3604 domain-containing protein [Myxococcota bacterium]|nr:DUF3604 domain-containing protein [Myxococcota bacterium]